MHLFTHGRSQLLEAELRHEREARGKWVADYDATDGLVFYSSSTVIS